MGNRQNCAKFQENLCRSNETISIFCPPLFRKRPILDFTTADWGNVYDMVSFTKDFLCKITYLVVFSVINHGREKKRQKINMPRMFPSAME